MYEGDKITEKEIFEKYFKDYPDSYVLIGGMACKFLFDEFVKKDFRKTFDFDIVLVAENFSADFGKQLVQFIRDGGYINKQRTDTGRAELFRFFNPKNPLFPKMIELFGNPDNLDVAQDQFSTFIRIPLKDSKSSLSAILLDKDYYNVLLEHRILTDSGISILRPEGLILLKIKAWLSLYEEKEKNHSIQNKQIQKHRKDVILLTDEFLKNNAHKTVISPSIYADVMKYLQLRYEYIQQIKNGQQLDKNTRKIMDKEEEILNILRDSYVSEDKLYHETSLFGNEL